MNSSRVSSISARVVATFFILLLCHIGFADDGSVQPVRVDTLGTQHQLWMVSTRQASSCPSLEQTSRLQYWRCELDCSWRNSNISEVLGSDDSKTTTLIYVHENRVSETEFFRRLPIVCQQVAKFAPDGQPFRLIGVSWPSNRIGHRQRPDAQIKAKRSESHGFYLAWLLDQIHPDVPVTLFGDSFGPRMITASLHCLAGGPIHGQRLTERTHPGRKAVRAVLMSAALDAHWLSPGQRYGLALTHVEHMLITVNPADQALRWYPRMNHLLSRGNNALGYVGLRCSPSLGRHTSKVQQLNVSGMVGRTHSWRVYEGSPLMMQQIAPHLFGE